MMKKLLVLPVILSLLILFTVSVPLKANSAARGWCEYGNQTVATGGLTSSTKVQKSYPQCTITVYLAGTVTPATIYSDNAGSPTPLANPFTGQANGSWQFYAAQGLYDVVLSGASLPVPLTLSGVSLFDSTAITTVAAVTLTVSGATTLTAVAADSFTMTAVLFAALGTPSNGVIKYCSNCLKGSNPCSGASTGAIAERLNGIWRCD